MLAALAPFAPLIGGAIGALGSLFAPKPKETKGSIDMIGLRKDAEAAGFNPLTIIRGGGLSGYGVTPAGPDMRLSGALQTFGSGIAQWQYDPYGQAKSQAEIRLAEAQISAFARQGAAPPNSSFKVPTATGAPSVGGSVTDLPLERIGFGGPQEAGGAISDIGWARTQTGWVVVPSKDGKERMEDDLVQQLLWSFRNIVSPQFALSAPPFPSFLGDRKNYHWNSFNNEWQPKPGTVPNVGGSF